MYMNTHRLQRGLSLVEVFVALLVLSVGLIALAKLQVDLVRGGGDSRARAAGLAIAEAKIEDLRTFSLKQAAVGVTWPVSTGQPVAWSMITGDDDGEGGRIAPGTINQAGVLYNLSWTSSVQATDGPVAGGSNQSLFKVVGVNVNWTGPDNIAQTVTATASIPDTPPTLTALASSPIVGGEGPTLTYVPGLPPEVIPIDIGTGKRETTKPLPDVQAQGDYAHEVTFDVVNYHREGSQNVVDRREEFVTVNCRCELAGPGSGRTPARVAFTGNILRDAPGKVIPDKSQTGIATGLSQQPTLCDICCHDHHDGPAETVGSDTDYNRYNPTADDDHDHYLFDPNGDSVIDAADFDLASSAGDPYDEACRLKRINGVFQVFEDWNLGTGTILAMPENDLTITSIQEAYTTFVQDYVKNSANTSLPAGTTPTFSTTTLVPGGAAQLSGRAIYIDHMPQNLLDFLNTSPPPNNFLSYVPFYEVNLTKLANWKLQTISPDADYTTVSGQNCSPDVTQTTLADYVACIANQAIVDETIFNVGLLQAYYRGLITAGPVSGQRDAQVYARTGNTGLTGTFALSTAENTATPVSSEYRFTVDAGQAISGPINKGAATGNPWRDVSVAAQGGSCSIFTSGSSRSFTCIVPTGWTGTVTATWTGHSVSGTNNVFPPNTLPPTFPVSFVLVP